MKTEREIIGEGFRAKQSIASADINEADWKRDVWIYPDTGQMSEMFSAWQRQVPGTVGDRFEHWERTDLRTQEQRAAIIAGLSDPLASLFHSWGNPSAEEMADVLAAEEARFEEQAKRFAEEAKG